MMCYNNAVKGTLLRVPCMPLHYTSFHGFYWNQLHGSSLRKRIILCVVAFLVEIVLLAYQRVGLEH